jgi:hypothetical protein
MDANKLLNSLPKFNNRKILIKKNQNVDDIIKALNIAHNQYKKDYDLIAKKFIGHNKKQTVYNIWKFLKKNIPYKAEPDTMQTIKSPAAIIHTGLLGNKSLYYNDCKNYSLFAGGILSALNRQGYNIPYVYRFASYNMFDNNPQHVFIVINPEGQEIWLDAVLSKFDYKKPYQYKKDKNFDNMMYQISGVDDVITGRRKAARKQKRQQRKTVRKARRAKRRAEGRGFGQRVVKTIKKVGRAVLKVAAAPVRNSFLLLVKLNFRSLATNLRKADNKAAGQLRAFWEGAGGRYQNLLTAISQGEKNKRLGELHSIGVAPQAAAASAAPLLVKVAALLKKLGINAEDVGKFAADIVKNRIETAIEKADTDVQASEQIIENEADEVTETDAPMLRQAARQSNVKLVNETGQEVTVPKKSIDKNILLLGGVGLAAVLLLSKRK